MKTEKKKKKKKSHNSILPLSYLLKPKDKGEGLISTQTHGLV